MKLRFGVGLPDGARSRLWVLWSHGADVYCALRTARGLFKVSLHCGRDARPPVCQLSVTSEFHRSLAASNRPPAGRHVDRWARTGPDANGDFLGTRILIPSDSIRVRPVEAVKDAVWLPAPPRGDAIEVALLFRATSDLTAVPGASPSVQLLAAADLPNGDRFRAVYYEKRLTTQDHEALAGYRARSQSNPMQWSSRPPTPDDADSGLLLAGTQPDGGHRVVDLELDGTPTAEA